MGGLKPAGDLEGYFNRVMERQHPPFDPLLQGLAFEVFHADEHLAIGGLVDVVDDADVVVLQRGGGLGLVDKPLFCFGIPGQFRRKEFESDGALEAGVLGLVDDTHPSAPQVLDNPVVGNSGTDEGRHCSSSWTGEDGTLPTLGVVGVGGRQSTIVD